MGCNCGGAFQPADGLVPADQPAMGGDPNYTWPPTPAAESPNPVTITPPGSPLRAPDGVEVWPRESQ